MEAARVARAAILQERAGLHPESWRRRADPYSLRGREAPEPLKSIPLGEGCRPQILFLLLVILCHVAAAKRREARHARGEIWHLILRLECAPRA